MRPRKGEAPSAWKAHEASKVIPAVALEGIGMYGSTPNARRAIGVGALERLAACGGSLPFVKITPQGRVYCGSDSFFVMSGLVTPSQLDRSDETPFPFASDGNGWLHVLVPHDGAMYEHETKAIIAIACARGAHWVRHA